MLRYKTKTRPGLVALYDIRPGNGAGPFLQPRSPHGAFISINCDIKSDEMHVKTYKNVAQTNFFTYIKEKHQQTMLQNSISHLLLSTLVLLSVLPCVESLCAPTGSRFYRLWRHAGGTWHHSKHAVNTISTSQALWRGSCLINFSSSHNKKDIAS